MYLNCFVQAQKHKAVADVTLQLQQRRQQLDQQQQEVEQKKKALAALGPVVSRVPVNGATHTQDMKDEVLCTCFPASLGDLQADFGTGKERFNHLQTKNEASFCDCWTFFGSPCIFPTYGSTTSYRGKSHHQSISSKHPPPKPFPSSRVPPGSRGGKDRSVISSCYELSRTQRWR